MEYLYVEIASENNLKFFICYYPKENLNMREWNHYALQLKSNTLIIGDFNGHHKKWDKFDRTNQSGNTLNQFLENNGESQL